MPEVGVICTVKLMEAVSWANVERAETREKTADSTNIENMSPKPRGFMLHMLTNARKCVSHSLWGVCRVAKLSWKGSGKEGSVEVEIDINQHANGGWLTIGPDRGLKSPDLRS